MYCVINIARLAHMWNVFLVSKFTFRCSTLNMHISASLATPTVSSWLNIVIRDHEIAFLSSNISKYKLSTNKKVIVERVIIDIVCSLGLHEWRKCFLDSQGIFLAAKTASDHWEKLVASDHILVYDTFMFQPVTHKTHTYTCWHAQDGIWYMNT